MPMPEHRHPLMRWTGGKWRLASRIVAMMPPHEIYVETHAGAASVFFHKPPVAHEVLNDLNREVVNLYQVLRDPELAEELQRQIVLTPFSREEFLDAYLPEEDPVRNARKLIVRAWMSHGGAGASRNCRSGFRTWGPAVYPPSATFAQYPESLRVAVERLRGTLIECCDGVDLVRRYDAPNVLMYVDPPYLPDTRSSYGKLSYQTEMTVDQHEALLDALAQCEASVLLSGYAHPLYEERLAGWGRHEFEVRDAHANLRTEVVWSNPALIARQAQGDLFREAIPA